MWATLGLVWLNSKSSDTVPSFYISSHAKFLANLSLHYTFKKVGFSLTGVYKKRQSQQVASPLITKVSTDYFVLNAKANAVVWKDLSIFAEVDNITNRSYTDLIGARMPGRWFLAGFKIALAQ